MNIYDKIIEAIFTEKYENGMTSVPFGRQEIIEKARALGIDDPKNLGDVIYSYKYRKPLPSAVRETAPEGRYWRLKNTGISQYAFVLTEGREFVESDAMLVTVKVPDGTPSMVRKYSFSDEQALLAIVRYNRLIDLFLGIVCHSLQNHLRTTVEGIGQIETDEIYVGVDKFGRQFIIPVEAKGGSDKLGVSQIEQDIMLCKEKYPNLICRPIACQFLARDAVAVFEFGEEDGSIVKLAEKHYKLVPSEEIGDEELSLYGIHGE